MLIWIPSEKKERKIEKEIPGVHWWYHDEYIYFIPTYNIIAFIEASSFEEFLRALDILKK